MSNYKTLMYLKSKLIKIFKIFFEKVIRIMVHENLIILKKENKEYDTYKSILKTIFLKVSLM